MKLNLGTNYNTYPFSDMTEPDQALYLFRLEAASRGFKVEIINHNDSYVFFKLIDLETGIKSHTKDILVKDFLELEFLNTYYCNILDIFNT